MEGIIEELRETLGIMEVLIFLIVVMASQLHACQTHQIADVNYIQFMPCQL